MLELSKMNEIPKRVWNASRKDIAESLFAISKKWQLALKRDTEILKQVQHGQVQHDIT